MIVGATGPLTAGLFMLGLGLTVLVLQWVGGRISGDPVRRGAVGASLGLYSYRWLAIGLVVLGAVVVLVALIA